MSTQSTDLAHSLLITLSVVVIVLLLINTYLLVSRDKNVENWDDKNLQNMWDHGGVYNGFGIGKTNEFDVKIACSCSGYGVKRPNDQNMPYNNDSNLYNSPAQSYMLPKQEQR